MLLRPFLIVIALLCGTACAKALDFQEVQTLPSAEVEARLPAAHPMIVYGYAARLFSEGRRDEAVMWLYVGQLRWRFRLLTEPDLPRDEEPAAMGTLHATVGATILAWAGGAPRQLAASIDRALQWDEDNANATTSKVVHRAIWHGQREGLREHRNSVIADRESILADRKARGLEIREP